MNLLKGIEYLDNSMVHMADQVVNNLSIAFDAYLNYQEKDYIVNDLKDIDDYPFSSLTFALESRISNRPTFDETIKGIKDVTKKDVINVCNKIKLDTIYVLTPGDENE